MRILGVGDEEEDEGDWTQTKFRIYHFHLSLSHSGNEGKTDAVFIKNIKNYLLDTFFDYSIVLMAVITTVFAYSSTHLRSLQY